MENLLKKQTLSEKKFWNSRARSYDKLVSKFFPKVYGVIFSNVIRDVDASEKLLEVATGTGEVSLKLGDYVSQITAIDFAPEMLNVAREKSARLHRGNIDFQIGNIYHLAFPDRSFDTVVASNILHLLSAPQLALQEIKRVLTDKGKIIAPTYCHSANLRSRFLTGLLTILGQQPKYRWSRKSFKDFIENSGFVTIREIYVNDKIPLLYLVAVKK